MKGGDGDRPIHVDSDYCADYRMSDAAWCEEMDPNSDHAETAAQMQAREFREGGSLEEGVGGRTEIGYTAAEAQVAGFPGKSPGGPEYLEYLK